MDYKKIVKNRALRRKILQDLSFIPDSVMLTLQYRIKLGRNLNLINPKRFTEKLQWYKINYRNPLMHQCVDKYLVRDYVKSKGLEAILIPLIAHYDSLAQITWDELPNQFVMKTTHGGGGLNVLVCYDKAKLSETEVKEKLDFSNQSTTDSGGREWAYYGLKPGIVAEKLLINRVNPDAGINDYKFFCYEGKAKYIIVDVDRYISHKRNFYDRNWKNLHIVSDCPSCDRVIEKPKNLDKMIQIAERLSEDFPYVRVDLYDVDGKVYFGELTFYPWSGYVQYEPDEWDYELGRYFKLIKYNSGGVESPNYNFYYGAYVYSEVA